MPRSLTALLAKDAAGGGARTSPDDPNPDLDPSAPLAPVTTDIASTTGPDDELGPPVRHSGAFMDEGLTPAGAGGDDGAEPDEELRADPDVEKGKDPGVGEDTHPGGVDRDSLADSDFAGPHRSFPVVSPGDVEDALHLAGHADDPEAVRENIRAIARRKGFPVPGDAADAKKYSPSQPRVAAGDPTGGQFTSGSSSSSSSSSPGGGKKKAPAKKPAKKKPASSSGSGLRAEAKADLQQAKELDARAAQLSHQIASLHQKISALNRVHNSHIAGHSAASTTGGTAASGTAAASASSRSSAAGGSIRRTSDQIATIEHQLTGLQSQRKALMNRAKQLRAQAAQLSHEAAAKKSAAAPAPAPAAAALTRDLIVGGRAVLTQYTPEGLQKMMTTWTQQNRGHGQLPGHAADSPGSAPAPPGGPSRHPVTGQFTPVRSMLAQGHMTSPVMADGTDPFDPAREDVHLNYQPSPFTRPLAALATTEGSGPLASSIACHQGQASVMQMDAANAASPFLAQQQSQPPSGNPALAAGAPVRMPAPTPARTPGLGVPMYERAALQGKSSVIPSSAPGAGLNRFTTHVPGNAR